MRKTSRSGVTQVMVLVVNGFLEDFALLMQVEPTQQLETFRAATRVAVDVDVDGHENGREERQTFENSRFEARALGNRIPVCEQFTDVRGGLLMAGVMTPEMLSRWTAT